MLPFYNNNPAVLEKLVAEFGDQLTYGVMRGVAESPALYEIFARRGVRYLHAEEAVSNAIDGIITSRVSGVGTARYIKTYVPELDFYVAFTAAEYEETVRELTKLKYKGLRQIIAPGIVSKFAVVVDSSAATVKKLLAEYFGTSDVTCEGSTCIVARMCVSTVSMGNNSAVGMSAVSTVSIDIAAPTDTSPRDYDTMFAQFVSAVDPKCTYGIRPVSVREGIKYITARDTVLADNPADGPYPTEYYGGEHTGSCMYFLQMNKPYTDCYKYGITDELHVRLKKHKHKIRYWKVVRVFDLNNSATMREVERRYKKSATDRGILAPRLGYTEVVQTMDPTCELRIIEGIIAECNL